jgi:CheY-like chemotaxis protein
MNTLANKTILIVDDESIIAMSTAKLLEELGCHVLTAYSGPEAVTTVDNARAIDLILMDIDLGHGMDGTEAAEIILKKRDIPIVFLSSHIEPDIVEKTEGITSYGYVVKESGPTVLIASIKMAFKLYAAYLQVREKSQEVAATNEELHATVDELESTIERLERTQENLIRQGNVLRESEEKFYKLFHNSTNAIALTMADNGAIVDINETWCRLTGLRREEAIGRSTVDLDRKSVV